MELQNKQHHLQDQKSIIAANQNEVTDRIIEPCAEDNEIGKMLYQLVKEQLMPSVDIEVFDGNPLHYIYLRLGFQEAVEKRIEVTYG